LSYLASKRRDFTLDPAFCQRWKIKMVAFS